MDNKIVKEIKRQNSFIKMVLYLILASIILIGTVAVLGHYGIENETTLTLFEIGKLCAGFVLVIILLKLFTYNSNKLDGDVSETSNKKELF